MTSPTGSDRRRCRSGFTLLEVIVTVTILFVGIVAILQTFSNAVRVMDVAAETLAVDAVLREQMAVVDLQTRRAPAGSTGLTGLPSSGMDRSYRWTLSTKWLPGAAEDGLNEASLAVTGRDGVRRYSLASWFRNRGAGGPTP
jgi:type II secretory pathway pseudopilin PulG